MSRARGPRRRATLRLVLACAALALVGAGCANVSREPGRASHGAARSAAGAPRVHVVRAGETLYKIAWQYGVDQRDLQRWNGIRDPDVIHVGQRLRLTAPSSANGTTAAPPRPSPSGPAAPPAARRSSRPAVPPVPVLPAPAWTWPADGAVITRFGTSDGIGTGIGIGGRAGQAVRAAAAGRVVYAGSGLIGYGKLVIIQHNDTYLTAYGYNRELLVVQGQEVARGQTVAQMGTGPERQPRLHFEIRRNGVPIDPLQFFPGR